MWSMNPLATQSLNSPAIASQALARDKKVLQTRATEPRREQKGDNNGPPAYQRLRGEELGGEWPSPIAYTNPWEPSSIELSTEPAGTEGQIRLRLRHDEYQPFLNSMGPGAGRFHIDYSQRTKGSSWTSLKIRPYQPEIWHPFEPAVVRSAVYVEIADEDVSYIQRIEQEHVSDFRLAWDLSVGKVSYHVSQLAPGPLEDVLAALVDRLIDANGRYLIPANPDYLPAWGPRLKELYIELAYMSHDRDKKREHAPVAYTFTLDGATDMDNTGAPWQNDITVRFSMPPLKGDSEAYIKTDRINVVFGDTNFASYREKLSKFAPGKRVKLNLTALKDGRLAYEEAKVYGRPAKGDSVADDSGMLETILSEDGGEVVVQDGDHVWLKLDLSRFGKDFRSDIKKYAKTAESYGYARIRAQVLS